MTTDQASFLVGSAAFNNLLRGPGTVLVDSDHGEMGCNTFEHSVAQMGRSSLEELLNDSVANVVASKLLSVVDSQDDELLTSAQSSMRSMVIWSISSVEQTPASSRFLSSFNLTESKRRCGRSPMRGMAV